MSRDAINLNAVYWDSVGMMRGQYLTEDREFVLDQLRLLALAQGAYGVAKMPREAFSLTRYQNNTRGGIWECTLKLLECRAIMPSGYPAEIVISAGMPLCAPYVGDLAPETSATGSKIAVYLGIREGMEPIGEQSSQGRIPRRFSQMRYLLSTTRAEQNVEDWLCIGRLVNDITGLREDDTFIPECLRLDSMPRLIIAVKQIQEQAENCLTHLNKLLVNHKPEAGIMSAALMEANVVLDWGERPRAYLNRVYRILMQLNELRFLLPHHGQQMQILAHLAVALREIPPEAERRETDWGYLLYLISEALRKLAEEYKKWEAGITPDSGPGGGVVVNSEKPFLPSPGASAPDVTIKKRSLINWRSDK